MTRKELRNIRNLRQLERAHLEILNDLNRSKNAMRKDVKHIENLFKPSNLFNSGWRVMAPTTPTPGQLLLGLVRRLKARLQGM
jgi:hypothetical protein